MTAPATLFSMELHKSRYRLHYDNSILNRYLRMVTEKIDKLANYREFIKIRVLLTFIALSCFLDTYLISFHVHDLPASRGRQP